MVDTLLAKIFGTKHARHVSQVFAPLGRELEGKVSTSASVMSTPIFHTLAFTARTVRRATRDDVLAALRSHRWLAFTKKAHANRIFAFARTHLFAGRVLAQAIIYEPSIAVLRDGTVKFHAFTPQDGNVVISNLAAVIQGLAPDRYHLLMGRIEDVHLPRMV